MLARHLVGLAVAMSALLATSACAPSLDDEGANNCMRQGYHRGSPAFEECVGEP